MVILHIEEKKNPTYFKSCNSEGIASVVWQWGVTGSSPSNPNSVFYIYVYDAHWKEKTISVINCVRIAICLNCWENFLKWVIMLWWQLFFLPYAYISNISLKNFTSHT